MFKLNLRRTHPKIMYKTKLINVIIVKLIFQYKNLIIKLVPKTFKHHLHSQIRDEKNLKTTN